jgi:hypothetical protein
MSTTTLVVALASLVASYAPDSLSWHADYGSAKCLGTEEARPLAVFIGSGKAGWNQVSRDGPLGNEVKQLLAEKYICVYINTDLEAGKQLALNFDVHEGSGLIISDHTGNYQAFRHSGNLPSDQLVRYLDRYADPERIVRTTETNASEQPSSASYYGPLSYYPAFSGGGRSC